MGYSPNDRNRYSSGQENTETDYLESDYLTVSKPAYYNLSTKTIAFGHLA
jgi:hypothetical protein